ncbi:MULTISPECIES: 2TM domain-containing protein [unclassified Serratia (in: enterobacteria)]|uniref:2TM domain-containing protein n=1 Tax=unclassified Serratia (in: enterobacteria) TaxID=2647522 RepID=UPI000508D72B|nr:MULTISPECIES: 2TM domain-containing protein [unclassified Serratia (in: enterobacteria)]KFK92320.1 DNA-binding protein [Serratia sp. Ag2]KFK96068.1 DNA-binding protein [Serratia sp. Ag1]
MSQNCIKQLRLSRAWSQEQLAELSSLSVRTIQRIENGEQASLETLSAIAAVFNISVTEISGSGEQPYIEQRDNALDQQIENAKARVAAESNFYRNLLVYVVVNLFLYAINHFITPASIWFVWPLAIWGTFILLQGAKVFFLQDWLARWQQERLQKILRK